MFAQDSTKECVLFCEPNFYAYSVNRTCLSACPSPYFKDSSSGSCVLECPIHTQTYADSVLRECTPACVNHTINSVYTIFYADKATSRCVSMCPSTPQKLYGYNSTN